LQIDSAFLTGHFEYSRWASNRCLEAVSPLTNEELTREMYNSFGGILGTLVHIYQADRIWLSRLLGVPRITLGDPGEKYTLAELHRLWNEVHDGFHNWASGISMEETEGILEYRNLRGHDVSLPIWQTCMHIVNHASYHRGQITTMLRQAGHAPASVDLTAYYLEQAGK
jgi:uncharacterized damage-inducible protein DinB